MYLLFDWTPLLYNSSIKDGKSDWTQLQSKYSVLFLLSFTQLITQNDVFCLKQHS